MDDLFYHDSLAEEGLLDFSPDDSEECSCIGLFLEDGEDENEPPSKFVKNDEEDAFLPNMSFLFPIDDSIEEKSESEDEKEVLSARRSSSEKIIASITDHIAHYNPKKTGVDDITTHFIKLFGGRSSFSVL